MTSDATDQIAIIGMAGRFPGARDLDEYWRNLRDGVESVMFPADDELLAAGAERGSGHAAEVHLRETAKFHLKGKDYIVEDGDIVHIRHSG